MKSKKIQAIVIASALAVNLLMPGATAFADESNGKGTAKEFSEVREDSTSVKNNEVQTVEDLSKSINEVVDKTDVNNLKSLSENKELTNKVYAKELISRIGDENFKNFISKDKEHEDFISWLLSDNEAMELYLNGGLPSKKAQGSMGSYRYADKEVSAEKELSALDVWSKIWNSDKEASESGMNLKIAIATALEFASPVNTWLTNKPLDPVSRYKTFKDGNNNNEFFDCFRNLSVKDLRNVVNIKITDEDVSWLRQYVRDLNEGKEGEEFKWQHEHVKDPNLLSQDRIGNTCSTIHYTTTNPFGQSVFKPGFYGENPTIARVVEYGGVCGAASKFGTACCQVFGVPAFPVGQPGHCAFLHLNSKNNWALGYNVAGWEKSNGYYNLMPDMFINENVNLNSNIDNYLKSEELRMLAMDTNSKEKSIKLLDQAISVEPLNYMAFENKIDKMLEDKNTTKEEFKELNSQIINSLKDYPQIMENLLAKIRSKVLENREDLQNYINEYKVALEGVSDSRQTPYANKLLTNMITNNMYLATFSFDGENGGKLVGIKANSEEYSLDGGKTYKVAKEDSQKLSREEIESINSEDGILVRVKGTENPNLIKINKGGNISLSINDEEDLVFGLDNTCEFSIDNGKTWTKYTGENLPELKGDVTLLGRKFANGTTTSGETAKVVFTTKGAPEGLILHKNMKVFAFSSQQNSTTQAAARAIDGNRNLIWHTKWNRSDKSPFITIELDKEYDINKLTYLPRQSGNSNGNILKCNILTSLDGENFTKVATCDWKSDRSLKTATFDKTKAKYVKIEVLSGANGYASAADFSLFTK